MTRTQAITILVLTFFGAAGCGGNDGRIPVAKTTGKLSWPGHEVLGLTVVFHPADASKPKPPAQPTGVVQKDGTFAVTCYDTSDGAPAGDYVVTIREAPRSDGTPKPKMPAAKYLDAKTSPLKVTIEKKSVNELPPLVLSD